ncbi:MAG: restriction endonuclease subunit S [Rhodoferax sp.]|uniref:restriction endonuclease subunit S n=1 Tax=Rhodoferax sp. TaxID=50421 RepID=UPI003262FE2A
MLLSNLNLLATAPGGIAKLRELILTLAVQGKLVPQDASDEPASELLRKIRAEKDRLIAEGKIKRDKPLAGIGDDTPFELPEKWEWVRLIDLMPEFQNGASSRGDAGGQPITVLRLADIKGKRISLEATRQIPIARADIEKYRLAEGDILITRVNGSADIVGQFNLCDKPVQAIYCDHFIRMRIDRRWIAANYCALLGESALVRESIKSLFITTAGQKTVNQSHIGSLLFPLPPLAEQSRIVTRVEELMRLCDALEAKGRLEATQHAQLVSTLLATLTTSTTPAELAAHWQRVATHFDLLLDRPEAVDALEQTILQLAVRGLLVPQDPQDAPASHLLQTIRAEKDQLIAQGKIKRDKPLPPIAEEEKPFGLPVGWAWVRFDELIHPLKPVAYGVLVPGPDAETGIPFVRIADLSLTDPPIKPEKSISPEVDAQFKRTRLDGGEILMGVVGSIGKLGVAPATWAGANIARAICRIVPADNGLNDFVLFLLQTQFMQENFAGDTRTLAQPTLNVGLIRAALTPVPPPAEQSRIVARVTTLRTLCADLRQRLAASQSTQAQLAGALVGVGSFSSEP